MSRQKRKTKKEYLQDIVNDYIKAGEPWPAGRKDIARWAVRNKRWESPLQSKVERCAQELAEAMRAEMELDPQGRSVRAKHCAKIIEYDDEGQKVRQQTLWFDRSAPPNLMHISM